jgi:hypothetical protein
MLTHAARHPELIHFVTDGGGRAVEHSDTWRAIGACFARVASPDLAAPEQPDALFDAVRSKLARSEATSVATLPTPLQVLDAALLLRGASMVVYRSRTLIEFKTERLTEGVTMYVEEGHRSWQIGAFEDHHGHLDLDAVTRVHFDAEPVSCQGGRLNWTVWFLGDRDCGNPYRPEAVCSVTLNRPYTEQGAREAAIIEAVYALHDQTAHHAFVTASETFLASRRAVPTDGT